MEYYINLAKAQHERFLKFCTDNPAMDIIETRRSFFSQNYEVNISFSIVQGITECEEYNEKNPPFKI